MDDQESQESLLESHYEQQRADNAYNLNEAVRSSSHPLSNSSGSGSGSTNANEWLERSEALSSNPRPPVVNEGDDTLILRQSEQGSGDFIERVPDVETRVNSSLSDLSAQSKNRAHLRFDDTYLKSVDGALKLIQIIMTLTSLICVVSSESAEGGYLSLPLSLNLRVFLFSLVTSLLSSVVIVFLHVSSLIHLLAALKWPLVELVYYSLLTLLLLVGSSLVASNVSYYQDHRELNVSHWTENQLLSAVVLGFGAMCLYAGTAAVACCRWKQERQMPYSRYQMHSAASGSTEALA